MGGTDPLSNNDTKSSNIANDEFIVSDDFEIVTRQNDDDDDDNIYTKGETEEVVITGSDDETPLSDEPYNNEDITSEGTGDTNSDEQEMLSNDENKIFTPNDNRK